MTRASLVAAVAYIAALAATFAGWVYADSATFRNWFAVVVVFGSSWGRILKSRAGPRDAGMQDPTPGLDDPAKIWLITGFWGTLFGMLAGGLARSRALARI